MKNKTEDASSFSVFIGMVVNILIPLQVFQRCICSLMNLFGFTSSAFLESLQLFVLFLFHLSADSCYPSAMRDDEDNAENRKNSI